MDLSISNPTPTAAGPSASARPVVGQGQPDLATRIARFDELSATVLDASGKSTEDQQLAAYQALHTLSVTGQLIGIEEDRRKVLDQATFESDIGKRSQQLSKGYIQSMNAALEAGGGAAGALKAALSTFDNLSSSDQNVLFATTLNAADRTGAAPHADAQAWRENTSAQLKVVDYMKSAGVVGANGQLDHKAAAAKAGDAKFASALRLSLRRDNNSADWTRSVLQLFGADRAADRVDLSPAAKQLVAQSPPAASTPTATAPTDAPYRAGTLISRTA
jgi:hypothetical protein